MSCERIGRSFAAVLILTMLAIPMEAKTRVTKAPFGKMPDGTPVEIYTLQDGSIEARILTYGGVIQSLKVPDRKGHAADVVLGFNSLDQYIKSSPFFGALVGRYANRIANGEFKLDGKTYTLPKNDGPNTLHGGTVGFDKVVWEAKEIPDGIQLTHVSKNGDQGFPGDLTAVVRYTLTGSTLRIDYSATTDKETVINLTNHSYFNLSGQGNGTILHDEVRIDASKFTPVDSGLIPTGEIKSVAGTPFDFRKLTVVGSRIDENNEQLKFGKGYDVNWVLDKPAGKMGRAAEVYDPESGRVLQVYTTQPGLQFYTGNHIEGTLHGKDGKTYGFRSALCLETQHFPDSPNHPKFPTTELKPGQRYHQVTEFKFSAK